MFCSLFQGVSCAQGPGGPRSCTVDLVQLILQALGVSRACWDCAFLSAEGAPRQAWRGPGQLQEALWWERKGSSRSWGS